MQTPNKNPPRGQARKAQIKTARKAGKLITNTGKRMRLGTVDQPVQVDPLCPNTEVQVEIKPEFIKSRYNKLGKIRIKQDQFPFKWEPAIVFQEKTTGAVVLYFFNEDTYEGLRFPNEHGPEAFHFQQNELLFLLELHCVELVCSCQNYFAQVSHL